MLPHTLVHRHAFSPLFFPVVVSFTYFTVSDVHPMHFLLFFYYMRNVLHEKLIISATGLSEQLTHLVFRHPFVTEVS